MLLSRNRNLCIAYAVLCLMVNGRSMSAQALSSLLSGSKENNAAHSENDPLRRTSPRSSIYNFLEACHENNLQLASQYLDLRKIRAEERTTQGPELARELGELLDRDPQFEVNHLSSEPEGDVGDGLAPEIDNLETFRWDGQNVTLQMERVTRQDTHVWLVSADSVARIPQLASQAAESPVEKRLPQSLVETKLIGTPIWIWLALVLIALILSLLSRLLSRIVIALVRPATKRYAKSIQPYRLNTFVEPLRLLISIAVFRACMEAVAPSALLRDYILNLLALLFVLGAASLVMRFVDVISDQVTSRLDARQQALSYSVIPLFVRIIKICIFCLAVVVVLSQWGYSTNTILAGVGVGGLAIALAAQKTIENLFGSISIISDRPVLVGDFCQFGTQSGTVEDIGLRSTRIRTLDRTVVTIPNSVFSTMTLENFSRRDRMWFHPTLHLRRDTQPEQISEMMETVAKILQEHPMVDASGLPLRFTSITNQSFALEIFAYVLTADSNEYLKIQTQLLLRILEAANTLKVRFAVPLQESITVAPGIAQGAK